MKRLVLAMILALVLVGTCTAAENVIRNGDFSVLKDDGLPAEWWNGSSRGEVEFFADGDIDRTGDYSYRIEGYIGDSHGQIGIRLTNEEVTPGGVYQLSLWYRTERFEYSTRNEPFRVPVVVRVRFYDGTAQMTVTEELLRTDRPEHVVYYGNLHFGVAELRNGEWLPFETKFKVPEEMQYMYVEVFLWHTSGILWIDDVQMVAVEE
ncbi:MAG TPA: hypothetical protein GXX57_09325 [Firmicutes bacterium]|mgnify:CR=1 FL=1|nr:hypothetical protein [Bacillota bacterium]